MIKFKNLPIRTKQVLIIMLSSGVALLFACSLFLIFDVVAFRRELAKNITVLAEAVGSNCAVAIDFNDATSAEETLSALRANDSIVAAAIYTNDTSPFATYQRDLSVSYKFELVSMEGLHGHSFDKKLFRLYHPIKQDGVTIGRIFVASDMDALTEMLITYAEIVGFVFALSMLVVFAFSSQVQRFVSNPILKLANISRMVAENKDYSVRATKQSEDELGELVDGFNTMLGRIQTREKALQEARDNLEERVAERTTELEEIHSKLVGASRQAGMAEIATNVLHNVGNVLNSLNVSASIIFNTVKQSRVAGLSKLNILLDQKKSDLGVFITTDPKGQKIPQYLKGLSNQLLMEQKMTLEEIASLRGNIEHVNEIVSMQQSYARISGVWEIMDIHDLIEDSLRLNDGALKRHQIRLVRDYGKIPPLNVEKHKVLQVMVNLIRNAKYACEESGHCDKCITIKTSQETGYVRVSVIDNGIGIHKDNLNRIFNHGFTTRDTGHGFGLHGGALAAKEMGGRLTVQSKGPGRGATFMLDIPNVPPGSAAGQSKGEIKSMVKIITQP